MFIKPSEYNGETIIKLSALVGTALAILKAIKDVTEDEALLADLQVIITDIEDLIASLKLMEIPQVFKGKSHLPSEDAGQ